MLQAPYNDDQSSILYSISILISNNNAGNSSACNGFWDPVNARICPHYVLFFKIIPFVVGLAIITSHVLRLLLPYRPKWLQPFVKELVRMDERSRPSFRRRINLSLASLLIISICGSILQAIVAWRLSFRIQAVCSALAWAITIGLVAILQPRTTPYSLLIIYASIVTSQMFDFAQIIPGSRHALIMSGLPILMGLSALFIILNMPMRDPRMPRDEISPPFTTPTSEFRSPEDNLTLWQFLTVSWMSPLIAIGSRRQLNDEDIWTLGYEFQHTRLHETFRELQGSVITRLLKANIIDLILVSIFGILELVANLSTPILLQQLLRAMENPSAPRNAAIVYAFLSLVVRFISSQSGVLSLWFGRRCYERSRGEMITMLFEKTLSRKIIGVVHENSSSDHDIPEHPQSSDEQDEGQHQEQSPKPVFLRHVYQVLTAPFRRNSGQSSTKYSPLEKSAKEAASMGKILNLMRGDVYEIAQRFWEFQALVTSPLGLVLSIALIWRLLGWPCLIGILTVVLGQLINAFLARILLRWETLRRSATDSKLQKISQFVEAIRHLRWYGWQDTWCGQIMEARQHELSIRIIVGMWNILIGFTNQLASGLFPVGAFYGYSVLAGHPLRVDVAFPALQVFTMLESNLRDIPGLITVLINARVSVGRLEDFMKEPDINQVSGLGAYSSKPIPGKKPHSNGLSRISGIDYDESEVLNVSLPSLPTAKTLVLEHASFNWPGATSTVLRNITISFPRGLTVICGKVGSGKTALLQALLGELDQTDGDVFRLDEMTGYCAQAPWLQSMSIKDNILFSAPYEEERYRQVLEACALVPDMTSFKHGDLSNIGENGVGLSGGQKARVALARAVYSRANVLLLDDPISALDQQTAEFIVTDCLKGKLMKDRTVILVTHRTDLCQGLAEQFVEVSDGTVRILDLQQQLPSEMPISPEENTAVTDRVSTAEDDTLVTAEKFMDDEHRAHGGVKAAVYWEYIKAGKLVWWVILILLLAITRLVGIAQTWFLKEWGEAYNDDSAAPKYVSRGLFDSLPSPETNVRPWLVGFALIAISKSVIFMVSQGFMLLIVYTTGRQMFKDVMVRVSHATFRFYDVTPVGRLMNRLTSDINTIDGNISGQFQMMAFLSITWVTSLGIIASITPIFLLFSLMLSAAFVLIFLRFLPSSQSLRRLEMVSLSPLMSNFGALLNGLTTVRAFHAQHHFQERVIAVTDNFQKMDHFYWSLQAWLMYRFDILSACSTLLLTLIAIYTGLSPGLTAFVLIASATFVVSTHSLCRTYGQLQMDFVSVERVVELLHLEQEHPGTIDPPAWWPTLSGDIIFEDVTIRYAPHLEPSLSKLSFSIKAGSSTAIIGRTGSGKSTLAMALLATVRPESGRILVDNIDLAAVSIQALRERATFVAQDPVLFPGSMRQNLDPMDKYSDDECEAVLLRICGRHQWTLKTQIDAGGRNLSQGQRQLIGLARTLLRRSPIVILDEATASIDIETAETIQEILHTEMRGCTVITIAHRLEAVKYADYCIVLDKGHVAQHGRAEDLLSGREVS